MENTLAVYSTLIVVINTICDFIISKLENKPPLDGISMVPPIGIIGLLCYPFHKRGVKSNLKDLVVSSKDMTNDEYNYMMDRASDEELITLFTKAKRRKDKRKIQKILIKYCTMHSQDYFTGISEAFND